MESIEQTILDKASNTLIYSKLIFIISSLILIGNFTISGLFGYVIYQHLDEIKHVHDVCNIVENPTVEKIKNFISE